ncbi:Ni/Fe hydrogenase subunit alpha [Euzebya sp.]|uniref:Ni/Fe hydrogenase subunit alpha n=1 Tax=Euzebya sp. TaxID=1971409 RepID=UPI003519396A
MHNIVEIDPVTRIEGHARITVHLDDAGTVSEARFHVTEFRGFEELCKGRTVWEMPSLTARTCGICPVSHLLASARAGDMILGVGVPPAGVALRSLANLAQIIQSHVLSFFHLSAPDLLLGMDAAPESRNIFALMQTQPDLVRRGVRLRQFGQEIIAAVTGERIHGAGIVPGGVAAPLTGDQVEAIAAWVPEARAAAVDTLELFTTQLLDRFADEVATFGAFDTLFLSMCAPDGQWSHDAGGLRVVDSTGAIVADQIDPATYREWLGEWGATDSYLKSPYWRPAVDGTDDPSAGIYRVGPLARLNVCETMGTPLAEEALVDYRERVGGIATSSFSFHHARLIEVLACVERIEQLLADPILCDPHVRATAGINRRSGVGCSEAPRGTLFHAYDVGDDGTIAGVDMLIATGQNNLAMNRAVTQVARAYVTGPEIPEGTLNRLEASIRAFDPCLSCSTHAIGQMPLVVTLLDHEGHEVQVVRRD